MIEIKLHFSTIAEASAFLSGRDADLAQQATISTSVTEVKPPKSTKAAKATDSAAPAVTASAAVESAPAAAPAPVATPSVEPVVVEYAKTDLPGRIAALVAAGRAGDVKPVLAQFGVKTGRELKPEDLAAFSAALKVVEEAAPEESLG